MSRPVPGSTLIHRAMTVSRPSHARRLVRIAVLMLYVLLNLGLPTGGAGASGAGECRCSFELRASGRCCCQKEATPQKGGCCAANRKASTKSCCAKPSPKSNEPKRRPSDHGELLALQHCPCGSSDTSVVLICSLPQIVPERAAIDLPGRDGLLRPHAASQPCGARPEPCVPPPERIG